MLAAAETNPDSHLHLWRAVCWAARVGLALMRHTPEMQPGERCAHGEGCYACRFVAGVPSVEAMLLIFIAALSVFVAVQLSRVSGELLRLGLSVRGIQVSLASLLAATPERGDAGSSPPGT